jgi:HEAT repeat protein
MRLKTFDPPRSTFVLLALALSLQPPATTSAEPQGGSGESRLDKMGREITARAVKDFKSKDPRKRLDAVKSLSSWKRPEGTAVLIQGLADVDENVRAESARSLRSYGKEAEPAREALRRALADSRPSVVAESAEALEQALGMTEKELGAARLRVLEEGDVTERFLAARGLVKQVAALRLVDPILTYIEAQLPGLSSSDDKSRNASRNNVEIGEAALQRLVKETRDRSLITALTNAARSFRQRNDVPLQALSLYEPRPEGWARLLVGQLGTRDPDARRQILTLMGRTATSAADVAVWAPEAARFEKDPDKWIRRAVVRALGDARGLASEQIDVPLRALTGEEDPDFREEAAEAIGEIGDRNQATPAAGKRLVAERAAPGLRTAMEKDPDEDVRDKAARALARLQLAADNAGPAKTAGPATPAPGPSAVRPKAASVDPQAEASALSFLRSRKLTLDTNSFFGALTERDPAVVQAYLDAGTNPNDRASADGDSPLAFLFRAAACSPAQRPTPGPVKEIVKLLLDRGADVNLADARANTPLMAAAMGGCDRETMGLLVKAGAKLDAKNAAGLTAFEMGLFSGHDGLEELIVAGYRLPPDKAALYRQGYASNPLSMALIAKAVAPTRK